MIKGLKSQLCFDGQYHFLTNKKSLNTPILFLPRSQELFRLSKSLVSPKILYSFCRRKSRIASAPC